MFELRSHAILINSSSNLHAWIGKLIFTLLEMKSIYYLFVDSKKLQKFNNLSRKIYCWICLRPIIMKINVHGLFFKYEKSYDFIANIR